MPADARDVLDSLRSVLRDRGYGELVQDEVAEADALDRPAVASLRQILDSLKEAVVPAMRATADASRLLGDGSMIKGADRLSSEEQRPFESPTVRLILGTGEAERLASEANDLERLLGELQRSVDADDQ
jgi:hypothetical protein